MKRLFCGNALVIAYKDAMESSSSLMVTNEKPPTAVSVLASSALRPYTVLRVFLPFIISILRDFRRCLFFGGPRVLTEEQERLRAKQFISKVITLGPTFVKFGQILAVRDDLLPRLYTDLLKDMHDKIPSFPFEDVHRIIESEFNRSLSDIFESFDPVPIAGASLGQVHRAIYQGHDVAVKVLRPGVSQLVATDMRVIRVLLSFARAIFGRHFIIRNLSTIVDEFSRVIKDEMDFEMEAKNYEIIAENLKSNSNVFIPGIYHDVTSKSVLTMDFVDGVRLDNVEVVETRVVNPMSLIKTLVQVYTQMIVIDGVTHADPHPGNLLLDAQGRIVMLDFGMVIRLSSETRHELIRTINAAVHADVDRMVQGFYKLDMVTPGTNYVVLRDAAQVLLDITLKTKMSTGHIIQKMVTDILSSFYRFPLHLPSSLVYLLRIATILEGLGITYDQAFNGVRFARPIIRRTLAENGMTEPRLMLDNAGDILHSWVEFTHSVERIVTRADREEMRIGVNPKDMGEIEQYFAGVQRRMIFGMLALAIAVVTAIVFTSTSSYILLVLGEGIALALFLMLLVLPVYRRWK